MPFCIFLFTNKSEFQKVRKTAKNEENPRKSRVFRPASFKTGTLGGATRNRTGDEGFADLCLTAWLWRRTTITQYKREQEINDNNSRPLNYLLSLAEIWSGLRGSNPPPRPWQGRALPNELNPQVWCLRSESNQRHGDFQSPALPTELQRHAASQ